MGIHDRHYSALQIEPISVIEQLMGNETIPADRRYHIGQAFKYMARAGTKDGEPWEKDIEKARNYLHRALTGEWLKLAKDVDLSDFQITLSFHKKRQQEILKTETENW